MSKVKVQIWGREFELGVSYQNYPGEEITENQQKTLATVPVVDYDAAKAGVEGYIRKFFADEMFHIPFEKRTDIVNYRYSITGYPCLYIGNSILSCWEEMHTPALDDFVVSRVQVNSDKQVKTLDLRIPYQTGSKPLHYTPYYTHPK